MENNKKNYGALLVPSSLAKVHASEGKVFKVSPSKDHWNNCSAFTCQKSAATCIRQ